MALQAGEIVDGKYRIVRMVGEGGMGAVYEGENTRIKRRVAIKVLHAAVAEKTDVVQRFEREAQAAGRIGSEHIVEVLDLGSLPSGERYMVMEFLDGEDVTGRIKRKKRLAPVEAAGLVIQTLEGLAAAHDAGIVHRDLKPDNIYILKGKAGRADFVKILDFGVSKFSALDNDMSMTRTGAVMGTPYYMSPEQAKGGKVDNRSDLYAIGVVLYQAVTGRVPFNASSFNELLFKIALESPEPIEQLAPDCPESFKAIVHKAMQREPSLRFQSAREFQQALQQWQMQAPPLQAPGHMYAATQPLPAVPDMRPNAQSQPQFFDAQTGSPSHFGQSGGGFLGGMSGTPQHGIAAMHAGTPLPLATPIPGTNTPQPGALGISQPGMAMTPQPRQKKNGTVVALVVVTVGILTAGGFGAYIFTRSSTADAGESHPASGGPTSEPSTPSSETTPVSTETPTEQTAAPPEPTPETTGEVTPPPTPDTAQPKVPDKVAHTPPPPGKVPQPPPPPAKTADKGKTPPPPPPGGRKVKTEL